MPGPWKEWKSKSSFPTLSTAPWKSRKQREIPTFPQPSFAALEKWKTKTRFSTFPPPLATIITVPYPNPKTKKGVGRQAASPYSLFRIIQYWKRDQLSGSLLD
jgi:hypothetical protein